MPAPPPRSFGHFRRGRLPAAQRQYTEGRQGMQVNVIVWVKNGGWIRDEFKADGMITGLKFTQERARAKRYDESGADLEAVRRYVEGMGCHYDLERDYFGEVGE